MALEFSADCLFAGSTKSLTSVANTFKLPGSNLPNLFDGSTNNPYLNVRVIQNNSTALSDGLLIGYDNAANGYTRIFDGGASNFITVGNRAFSSIGITKFLFGNQTDDGTFAQFAGDVKIKGDFFTNDGFIRTGYSTGLLPQSRLGGTISCNKSGGNAEVNLINTYDLNPTSTSFLFSQKTSNTTIVDLMTILRNGNIGIGTINPQGIIDVVSTTTPSYPKPRMTTTQINAITGMQAGAEVFDTTLSRPRYYNGTMWVTV